ncbi:MAG: virulence protein RhuM/Fic/DOC family protein [bacterium]|nr:virulence protein RhuM/Fic/DOC family protein [Candidatus Limimorpha equi]
MSVLFGKDQSVIARHIRNIFKEQELDEKSNMQILHNTLYKYKPTAVYNLDVIISVGYRVKSQNGVVFRRWANSILKQYLINGYAVNQKRIEQLGEVIRLLKRTQDALDSRQVLSVIEHYNEALNLLDSYDHQSMKRPEGNKAIYTLTYEECREVIGTMRFGNDSEVFGIEKDDSFKGSIGNIYQSYGGQDVYPTLEEKAANLLYFVTKNHSFVDGNKRIAATMFLYFLDKNQALFIDGNKAIDDYTLVALTIMIAESRPEEKEMMISVVMNCMK